MLEVPADAPAVWVGLALASAGLLGVVVLLPTAPAPDAAAAAAVVDAVAVADGPASADRRLVADDVRIRPRGIDLRTDAGTATAPFAFGPVTPVQSGTALDRILRGEAPWNVFATHVAFGQAIEAATDRDPTWERASHLVVRRVQWRDVTVTLVGSR